MSGISEKGFTLLEVVIALTVIAVGSTALLEFLANARAKLSEAQETFRDFLYLDGKLKRGNHEGLRVTQRELPDFPRIVEILYSYKDVFFVRYKAK